MRVTFLGHAGLYIETPHASILADPWLSGPAYHGSWWPFPDNDGVDREAIRRPTYLYISHLHQDHLDEEFLRDHVSKDAVVLLPDYPLGALERELRRLGFDRFVATRNREPVDLDGLRLTIPTVVSPADGPIGDSGLIVESDGFRLFDQNDSRPIDGLHDLGHVDVHFLQFSGAIGFPFLQGHPQRLRVALGRRKRLASMERARRYAEAVNANRVFPTSGPPCFLDPTLSWLNDFGEDEGNVFPDQWQFFEYMARHGDRRPDVILPGSVVEVTRRGSSVAHPMTEAEMRDLFTPEGKRRYLAAYRERKRPVIEGIDDSLRRGDVDLVQELREWWEPLMAGAHLLCAGINGRMTMDFVETPGQGVVVDFHQRTVEPWFGASGDDDVCHFTFPRALVVDCVLRRTENWSSDLLLSFRFRARERRPYNKFLFAFLSALSRERIEYVEDFYRREALASSGPHQSFFKMDLGTSRHLVQARCPHGAGDLERFLVFDETTNTLTCTLHGWRWRSDGTCLTADGHSLFVRPINEVDPAAEVSSVDEFGSGADIRRWCDGCSFGMRPPTVEEIKSAGARPAQSSLLQEGVVAMSLPRVDVGPAPGGRDRERGLRWAIIGSPLARNCTVAGARYALCHAPQPPAAHGR